MKNKGLLTTLIAASLTSACVLASCSKKLAEYPVEVSFDLNFETSAAAPDSISLNAGEVYGELPTVAAENTGYHFGWEYEVLLDPNGDFKRAMNVQNVPHVFVLDGKGKIVYNHAGYTEGGEQDIYDALQ